MVKNKQIRRPAVGDAVGVYLREMGKHELLTKEEEVNIFRRIEKAERKANRILNAQVGTHQRYSDLGHKILNGKVMVRIIVSKALRGSTNASILSNQSSMAGANRLQSLVTRK